MRNVLLRACSLVSAFLLFCTVAPAAQSVPSESATGVIAGKVAENPWAPIPEVLVTATNETTGKQTSTTTDEKGSYRLSQLTPGQYSIRFKPEPKYGYSAEGKLGISVCPAQVTTVEAKLHTWACSVSCVERLDLTTATPPGVVFQLSAERDVVASDSALWLKITLINQTKHSIWVEPTRAANRAFAYDVDAIDICNCGRYRTALGQQLDREMGFDSETDLFIPNPPIMPIDSKTKELIPTDLGGLRIPPGGILFDRVDLRDLLRIMFPGNYTLKVRTALKVDSSTAESLVRSNSAEVTIVSLDEGTKMKEKLGCPVFLIQPGMIWKHAVAHRFNFSSNDRITSGLPTN